MDFPESEYIEGTIYSGGFPHIKINLMQEFHLVQIQFTNKNFKKF